MFHHEGREEHEGKIDLAKEEKYFFVTFACLSPGDGRQVRFVVRVPSCL
jgi:hypothetical protein